MKKVLVIGSINMDFVINVEHMPLKGETILAESFELIPGGKGANQAYAIGKLGGKVEMLGAVGNDEYGKILIKNLSSVGVGVSHMLVEENANTGNAFIVVDENGDNNIIVTQGSNKNVDTAYIDENIGLIKDCDIVVLQLEIPIQTVIYIAKKAKELGKFIILDPAPAKEDLPRELFECVDIIKPNEGELKTLIGGANQELTLRESAQLLLKKGAKNVVVTLGGDGAYLFGDGAEKKYPTRNNVEVVDTTAAGDSFTASMALCFAQDKTIDEAIEFANKVASVVVTRKGAQTSIPTIDEIDE